LGFAKLLKADCAENVSAPLLCSAAREALDWMTVMLAG